MTHPRKLPLILTEENSDFGSFPLPSLFEKKHKPINDPRRARGGTEIL